MKTPFYEELLLMRNKYQQAINGIDAILEAENIKGSKPKKENIVAAHLVYNIESLEDFNDSNIHEAVVPQKVLYALRCIKEGTTQNVAKKLVDLIPSYDPISAARDARHHLSKYNINGIIKSKQIGNKNKYIYPL